MRSTPVECMIREICKSALNGTYVVASIKKVNLKPIIEWVVNDGGRRRKTIQLKQNVYSVNEYILSVMVARKQTNS